MNVTKELGRIEKVSFGYGGYQDAMFGITFVLSFGGGMGVADFKGAWSEDIKVGEHTKWSEEDRTRQNDETVRFINRIMREAKVTELNRLTGVPIEVTSEGMTLKSWRVLTEVL
jgi:hypothetical protein